MPAYRPQCLPVLDPVMITREALLSGWLERVASLAPPDIRIATEEELQRSIRQTLKVHEKGQDLWIFAYGSLIWNPAFHYTQKVKTRISGYHRRFCLWTRMGRGTDECPGLMLGLDRGLSCKGIGYRLSPKQIETELPLIWRREMVTMSYTPIWVTGDIEEKPTPMISFLMDQNDERYAKDMPDEELIATIARAEGPLGTCAEYLENTAKCLRDNDLTDRRLEQLVERVKNYIDHSRA